MKNFRHKREKTLDFLIQMTILSEEMYEGVSQRLKRRQRRALIPSTRKALDLMEKLILLSPIQRFSVLMKTEIM